MVSARSALNVRQRQVLSWIGDGCPDGVMQGSTYKTTAIALQSRGLVKISKKRGIWHAELTTAGRHSAYHDGLVTAPAASSAHSSGASLLPLAAPNKGRLAAEREPPASERLIADIQAAGGELRIDRRVDKRNHEQLVKTAIRFGKAPAGKWLTIDTDGDWNNIVIRLVDLPEWITLETSEVSVPGQLRQPHPAVRALVDDPHLRLTAAVRNRGQRLTQGLIQAALQRGYRVLLPGGSAHPGGHAAGEMMSIEVIGHRVGVRLRQELDRTPHVSSATELRRAERDSWFRIPKFDEAPSRRLTLLLINGREYGQSRWSDSNRRQLEDSLGDVLREIEMRAVDRETERLAAIERAAQRERQWQMAMTLATNELHEHRRGERLLDEASRWRQAIELNEYLDAMREAIAAAPEDEAEAGHRWLSWATAYVDRLHPLKRTPVMPEDGEVTAEALRPFLKGWSPYGPQRDHRW